jgi:phosphoglycolate phosphatase-like HAD superfamily hydrolase
MKAFLMFRDRDFDLKQELPWNADALTQDLELTTLFSAMAGDDKFLFDVAGSAILSAVHTDVDTVLYRQNILKDCLKRPFVITGVYNMAIRAIQKAKEHSWGRSSRYPDAMLRSSVNTLEVLILILKELRNVAEAHVDEFESEGLKRLLAMVKAELSDEYFATIRDHLQRLKFRDGVLTSAKLGKGNKGINYILRRLEAGKWAWLKRLVPEEIWNLIGQFFPEKGPSYSFTLHPRDDTGARCLGELKERNIHLVANAMGQSADHIFDFFKMLQTELAFYVGCLNLSERLAKKQEPICFPLPSVSGERTHLCGELYDICLALTKNQRVVGNDLHAAGKELVIITGANTGGKSTFLRGVGLAQIMMQSGMFVAAQSMSANLCEGVFTHYKREEDVSMESGKLDEELGRMSEIAKRIGRNSMLLFNESFTATNEREGSEIAGQIVSALLEAGMKMFFVTHLYTFADSIFERRLNNAIFLRAQRESDGTRTFKLPEGEPLETSYGEDLYDEVFLDSEGTELPSSQRDDSIKRRV